MLKILKKKTWYVTKKYMYNILQTCYLQCADVESTF
jgi:hypothetical protein